MIRTLVLIWFALLAALLQTTAQAQAPVIVENAPDIYPEPIDLDAWVDQQPHSWSGGGYGYGYGSGYDDSGSWWPSWDDVNPFAASQNDYLADAALNAPWSWTLLPDELIYRPELASLHTARLALAALSIKGFDVGNLPGGTNWYWDSTLGARVGIVRYGSPEGSYPQGFQFDVEGAVFPRVDSDGSTLIATDYRIGLPMSFGWRKWQTKFGYYHVSSHLGDEFLLMNPGVPRLNYVRNSIVWANSLQWTETLRTYADASWAFNIDGGAKPWEFQFGAEYSSICATGFRGSPFVAANGHILQARNWGGNIVFQCGWQWRAKNYGDLLRFGFQYLEGMTPRYEFFQNSERQLGLGLWYDF